MTAYSAQYAGWMRNYKAMKPEKLLRCIQELEGQYGDAYHRMVNQGGLLGEHLAEAHYAAQLKGNYEPQVFDEVQQTVQELTAAQQCPECSRNKRFYLDDYICKDCRDELEG